MAKIETAPRFAGIGCSAGRTGAWKRGLWEKTA